MFFNLMIMFCNKSDQSCNMLISNSYVHSPMSELIWKCYRCNLTFKDEDLATIHKGISSHPITKVKAIVA